MRSLAIFFFACLVGASLGDDEPKDMDYYFKECKEAHGISSNISEGEDVTHERKCFVHCVFGKYDGMNPDGTFDKTKIVEMTQSWFTQEDEKASIKGVVEMCLDEVAPDSDPCETSFLLIKCVEKKYEEQKRK